MWSDGALCILLIVNAVQLGILALLFFFVVVTIDPRPAGRGTPRSWGIVLPPTSETGDKSEKSPYLR